MIAGLAFVLASAYAVGGPQLLRRFLQMRSRATAALQPPTDVDMQRAAVQAAQDSVTRAQRIESIPEPASLGFIVGMIGVILLIAVVMFYVTGRRQVK